jgi:hypothetical protein
MESKDQTSDIRRVMCNPEFLKQVHACILELKQVDKSPKAIDFGVACAKVIAFIGICHPFVTDPILLRANNQSLIKQKEFNANATHTNDEVIIMAQSERVNPVSNMKYY